MATFAEKVARLKAEQEARKLAEAGSTQTTQTNQPEPANSELEHDPDLIPELDQYEKSPDEQEADRLIDNLDILDAYQRWCGKMSPKVGSKREGIMISCPRLDHPDKVPSAWINLDKQTWFCGRCEDGGDTLTLIARTKGWEGDTYQQGKNFHDLRVEIAADLGFVIRKTPTGTTFLEEIQVESEPQPEPGKVESDASDQPGVIQPTINSAKSNAEPIQPETESVKPETDAESVATITALRACDDEIPRPPIPRIEWEGLVPPNTFLYEWMNLMRVDDLPEEFYFWHGLTAIGVALGRDVTLMDSPPVLGNLFTCLYGPSGQGKSRSTGYLTRLLREALPYRLSDPDCTGVYHIPSPGSPEALIDSFSRPVPDLSDPKVIDHYGKVRGLVRFDELSTLIGRASRTGNPLKPALQSFYDGDPFISTSSRGHGNVEAHDSFCSAVTTTQPRAIRQVLAASDVDSGFANRWVYVMGHAKRVIPIRGLPIDIMPVVPLLKGIHTWASFGHELFYTEAARDRFLDFYFAKVDPIKTSDDALTSRIDLLLKKLILLFSANECEPKVKLEAVESAIQLFDYLVATYRFLEGDLGTGERGELEQAIMFSVEKFHVKHGKGPTARDIYTNLNTRYRDANQISRALSDLVTVGLLIAVTVKPARGATTERYLINNIT